MKSAFQHYDCGWYQVTKFYCNNNDWGIFARNYGCYSKIKFCNSYRKQSSKHHGIFYSSLKCYSVKSDITNVASISHFELIMRTLMMWQWQDSKKDIYNLQWQIILWHHFWLCHNLPVRCYDVSVADGQDFVWYFSYGYGIFAGG